MRQSHLLKLLRSTERATRPKGIIATVESMLGWCWVQIVKVGFGRKAAPLDETDPCRIMCEFVHDRDGLVRAMTEE